MKRYLILDTATSEILRSVTCADEQLLFQTGPGEKAIESAIGEPWSHYVDSTGKVVPKPPLPAFPAKWDPVALAWVDTRDAATKKRAVLTQLDAADLKGFTALGFPFQSDPKSIARIVLNVALNRPAQWIDANGDNHTFNPAQWSQIGQALSDFLNTNIANLVSGTFK